MGLLRDAGFRLSNYVLGGQWRRAHSKLEIVAFLFDPPTVQAGQQTVLKWSVRGANSVSIEGVGKVSTEGTLQVRPSRTTYAKLTAEGPGGTATSTAIVAVTASTWPRSISSMPSAKSFARKPTERIATASAPASEPGPTTMMKISAQISVSTERLTTMTRRASAYTARAGAVSG